MRLHATADGESHFEEMSVHLPSRRGIPMPEKIEVASST
jgi:hypothetical protein